MNGYSTRTSLPQKALLLCGLFVPALLGVFANAAPLVSVSASPPIITEGISDATFVFTRSGAPLTSPLTVDFTIPEAVSIAGLVDAAALATRTITIPMNEASVSAVVHPIEDAFHTGKKIMRVILKASAAYQ